MASEMVRPTVVSFLDVMLRDKEKNLRIEEGSKVAEKAIAQAGVKNVASALLLAVRKKDGRWEYNPKDDFLLYAGMDLIIMGSPEDKKQLEAFVA